MRTVPDNFTVHSMHCYFVLAGNSEIPIIYQVERIRDGRSFCTRTVQARQRGQPIFTTTMSFVRENSGGKELVEHAVEMNDVPDPIEETSDHRFPQGTDGPFLSQRIDITNGTSLPHRKKTRQWLKARGHISESGGHQAHLSALAYMSDSYFIGTVARVHNLWRLDLARNADKNKVKLDSNAEKELKEAEEAEASMSKKQPRIGMMVSLDHTIYFHAPRDFRADEWLYTEMMSPWAGDGRGLVFQHIFTKSGKLVATCVQEVIVRPS
jgi:acyl-CoA thioesterase 8